MIHSSQRRGYVLLMALLLLAMAAVALAGVTAESQRRAMNARSAAEDLQYRWAAISCQRSLLPHADMLLKWARAQSLERLNRVEQSLQLGNEFFTVVICDEQAKANINLLARYLEPAELQETVSQLAGMKAEIRLLPTLVRNKEPRGSETVTQPFASYGQVLGKSTARQLARADADRLTCWGDTKLNTRNATPETVAAVVHTVLDRTELDRFQQSWEKLPGDWRVAFRDANILPDKVKIMESRVTETSNCYSLWIIPQGSQPCQMAVQDGSGVSLFEW